MSSEKRHLTDAGPYRRSLGSFIFLSRWLQAPLYLGLIVAQGVYVYRFMIELWQRIVTQASHITETEIMLAVLGLIDVVMISNLLIMVIVGGYETFVSRLRLEGHPDQPEWLSHVNAGVLKVKLATALVGISSIHLLKTFVKLSPAHEAPHATAAAPVEVATNLVQTATVKSAAVVDSVVGAGSLTEPMLKWQVVIHMTFVLSALLLAFTDKVITNPAKHSLKES